MISADVQGLEQFGLAATCNAGGVGKGRESYREAAQGANRVILPDNDAPRRAYGLQVAWRGVARLSSKVHFSSWAYCIRLQNHWRSIQ